MAVARNREVEGNLREAANNEVVRNGEVLSVAVGSNAEEANQLRVALATLLGLDVAEVGPVQLKIATSGSILFNT